MLMNCRVKRARGNREEERGKSFYPLFPISYSLLFLCCSAALTLLCASQTFAVVVFPKTLDRMEDPVIIEGEKLPNEVLGFPLSSYGLFAFKDDKFVPIPFQIDEKKYGDYVFTFGPKASEDDDKGRLDSDDELVFMVKDSGSYAPQIFWPKGVKTGASIELVDPLNNKKAWAFLFVFDSFAPRSNVDYVSYDNPTETIFAQRYVMRYHPKAKLGFGYLAITEEGKGRGKNVNTVDRLKIRFEADTLFGIHIVKNEEDFTSKTIAWIDGPVRVIRGVSARIVLFWKIPSPAARLNNIYYFNHFEFPVRVDFPFEPSTFIKNSIFRVSSDGRCSVLGGLFYNSRNKNGVVLDGKIDEAEKALDKGTYKWSVATGDEKYPGGWFNRLFYDPKSPTHPQLYYIDDRDYLDLPEDESGSCPDIGYIIEKIELIKGGSLELSSVMYQVPQYKPGLEAEYLSILDYPLAVKCRIEEPLKSPPERIVP